MRNAFMGILLASITPGILAEESPETPSTSEETVFEIVEENPSWVCDNDRAAGRGTLFGWIGGSGFGDAPDLNEPLVTDRPDFTEASSTVGRGVAQLEVGYTYFSSNGDSGSTSAHSIGEPLLRVGLLADWLEFRIAWNYAIEEVSLENASGSEDLYLGFKIGLTPQNGILPEMALVPQMTIPTGGNSFTAEEVLPGCNWIYAWDLSERFAAGGSTQFNRAIDGQSGDTFTEWAQSLAVGVSLSERWGAYTEWFAFFPQDADSAVPAHFLNGGFTLLITSDIQWDIRAGVGLNESADDYFVGTGLSIRFH